MKTTAILAATALAAAVLAAAPARAQTCPIGTMPGMDTFGNKVCNKP